MKKRNTILILLIIIIFVIGVTIIKNRKIKSLEYDIAEVTSYNYFRYNKDGKLGVIERNGNIVIEAKYDEIIIPNPEKDIFICSVQNSNKNTVLNKSNEEMFKEYGNIEPIKLKNIVSLLCYEKNILKYEKDGLYGLISFDGKELTKNLYQSIENLQSTEGKFLVGKDNKYGVINSKGKLLVDIKYDTIKTDGYYSEEQGNMKSGFIVAKKQEDGYKYGYVDYTGKNILEEQYNEVIRVEENEEIYLIVSENGKYGVYYNSKEIVSPEYQSIVYSDLGVLIVQKNENVGVLNLKGEQILETKYKAIQSNGIYLYAEMSNGKEVFDVNGNKIDINFNKVVYKTENENYRIVTLVNNNVTYYGIENSDGVTLTNATYSYLEYLYEDYFIAKDNTGNLGIINSNGKILIDIKYDMIQKIKGKNIVQTLITDNQETEIYSKNLEFVTTMEDAIIYNADGYIIVYNDSEKQYFDSEGNKIDENAQTVKDTEMLTIPEEIKNYKKVQPSLENVYYEEK